MNIEEIYKALNPEIYEKFKTAIEIGKWPDGRPLSAEQKQICMQAVIAYEHKYVEAENRTGYVPPKPTDCGDDHIIVDDESPITWKK